MASHQDLLDLALRAARDAAAFIRAAHPPDPATWDRKAQNDFATTVDREAERRIAGILLEGSPASRVVGEELTPTRATGATGSLPAAQPPSRSTVTWVVDPLDGTTNFLHDYPAYAVSIAAVIADEPVAAVVTDLVRDLTYSATTGGGAWCGTRRLAVSAIRDPSLALIGTGFPFKAPASERMDEYLVQLRRILHRSSGVRRAGSAALDFAHVAQGRLDGFWEIGLAPWDVAAGMLLVREAGGLVTDFAGRAAVAGGGDFVAGNPAIHAWLLDQVTESR